MDHIFGEDSFYACLPRRTGTSKNKGGYSKEHDYILVYSPKKDLEKIDKESNLKEVTLKKYKFEDGKGLYRLKETTSQHGYNKKNDYTVEWNGKKYNQDISSKGIKKCWGWKKETLYEKLSSGEIFESNGTLQRKIYLDKRPLPSFIFEDKAYSSESGTKYLKDKLGLKFPNPKTIKMICELIKWASIDSNSIILDFFAGSGTTGQAVMELNREDDGNRTFILCTNNENKIGYDITFERMHRVIKGQSFEKQKSDFKFLKPFNNEKLRVINIDDNEVISLDYDVNDKIYEEAKKGLKLLDNKYNKKDLNFYYDLAALNPLKNEEDKFND